MAQRDYVLDLPLTDRDWLNAEKAAYTEPEYPSSPLPQRGVAYKRSGIVSLYVVFENNSSTRHLQGTLTFRGMRYAMPDENGDVPPLYLYRPVSDTFPVDLPPNTAQQFQVSFAAPSFVSLGHIEMRYDLPLQDVATGHCGENGTNGGYERWEKAFFVDATPVGLQATLWADYLEYTCRWAFGANGAASLREKMARGMYSSYRSPLRKLKYEPGEGGNKFFLYHARGATPRSFRLGFLTYALDNVDTPGTVTADCRDYAAALAVALMQNGQQADCVWMEEEAFSDAVYIVCTPMCASPQVPAESLPGNYTNPPFNYHVVVLASGKTFDSSSAYFYDTDGQPWKKPAYEWDEDPHWQNQLPGGGFAGLAAFLTPPYLPRPRMGPTSLDHRWIFN